MLNTYLFLFCFGSQLFSTACDPCDIFIVFINPSSRVGFQVLHNSQHRASACITKQEKREEIKIPEKKIKSYDYKNVFRDPLEFLQAFFERLVVSLIQICFLSLG